MLPAPLYSLFQVKVDYSTLGASNQFLYRTSKSRQTNREKDNDSPNKITKAHNSTFTRVILTLKKHKSTASGPAFCQVSGGAFLKSVIKSAIFSGFGQKVRAHILITIVSKYASLHGASGDIGFTPKPSDTNGLRAVEQQYLHQKLNISYGFLGRSSDGASFFLPLQSDFI